MRHKNQSQNRSKLHRNSRHFSRWQPPCCKKCRSSKQLLGVYQAKIERLEQRLGLWMKLPLGPAAIEAAERETEKFIERDKYGLYRGEAMLNCGLCRLEVFFDPDRAEPWLKRASDWFDTVKKMDTALLKLEVPSKSKAASQPPKNEHFTDTWTNILEARPQAGNLFNRRECKWYLGSKTKDAALWLGFIAFSRGNMAEAKTQWERIAEIDKDFNRRIKETRGSGTTSTRLLHFLETQPGLLHATKDELSAFKDKRRRFAVLFADCAYVAEKRELAEKIYRQLDAGELGALSKNEKAYVTYAIFDCLCWKWTANETKFLQTHWSIIEGSPTEKRALMGLANRMDKASVNYGNISKRLQLREQLITKFPKSPEAEEALYRNVFDMLIVVYDFENIEKYLQEKGPDNLLPKVRDSHKTVQSKIVKMTDHLIATCERYKKKHRDGRFLNEVGQHLESLTAKKQQFAEMEFYALP